MANDVTGKINTNTSSAESTLGSSTDQQKVPPLRIVLNSSGNQKSSAASSSSIVNQANVKQKGSVKSDVTFKGSGRVRIKLGGNLQQSNKNSSSSGHSSNKANSEDGQKSRGCAVNDKQDEESSGINITHLRRITRRSRKTVQVETNEDEESISSMTSLDENQSAHIDTSDNNTQDINNEQTNPSTGATSSSSNSNAANGSSNPETPRRYKRRKCENSESQSIDSETLLSLQNYRAPVQNSIELFKNIRKHVDNKINNLNAVHPKTPYGFRDYMLIRGAYLLDGNKLGNGTNLYLSEDGGLHTAPIGKYHALRSNRINYTVPNKAKVPLGLPVSSPLYDLFIEQEKERYKMRMQHIKEREKLTLAAEQEIMRVYNQAALAAANQTEPFSACTMLKHQEIYNYLDLDGSTILSREDAQQEQVSKPDGVRTRRRQHGQVSPPSTRREPNPSESTPSTSEPTKSEQKSAETCNPDLSGESTKQEKKGQTEATKDEHPTDQNKNDKQPPIKEAEQSSSNNPAESSQADSTQVQKETRATDSPNSTDPKPSNLPTTEQQATDSRIGTVEAPSVSSTDKQSDDSQTGDPKQSVESESSKPNEIGNQAPNEPDSKPNERADQVEKTSSSKKTESSGSAPGGTKDNEAPVAMDVETETRSNSDSPKEQEQNDLSDEDRRAYNREFFLNQLQEVDDKWEQIRRDMLVRHKNEAESLHAIQKLEWEWKTKEIGACDVRTTPVIDSTLVPKLNIFSQDY